MQADFLVWFLVISSKPFTPARKRKHPKLGGKKTHLILWNSIRAGKNFPRTSPFASYSFLFLPPSWKPRQIPGGLRGFKHGIVNSGVARYKTVFSGNGFPRLDFPSVCSDVAPLHTTFRCMEMGLGFFSPPLWLSCWGKLHSVTGGDLITTHLSSKSSFFRNQTLFPTIFLFIFFQLENYRNFRRKKLIRAKNKD